MPAIKLLHQQTGVEHQANTSRDTPSGSEPAVEAAANSSPFRSPCASTRGWCGPVAIAAPCSTDAAARGDRRHRRTLLLRRRRLLCRARDRHPPAQREPPPGHAGRSQRRRLHRSPAARPFKKMAKGFMAGRSSSDPWRTTRNFQQGKSPVYGEHQVIIRYRVLDLLWRPAGRLVRFVAVIHPMPDSCPPDVHRYLFGGHRDHSPLRPTLQDRTHLQAGGAADRLVFSYHFWMSDMKPVRRRKGNQHLHHEGRSEYRSAVERKLTPTTSSSRRASYAGDCFSIWPSPSSARLELVRLLVAHHSARHPTVGAGRVCSAQSLPEHAEYRPKQHLHEIHHRTTGNFRRWKHPSGLPGQNSAETLDSRVMLRST